MEKALPKFTQHMTAIEIEDALGQKAFKGAFKVSIVRHPLDRIISHFHWRNKTEKEEPNFSNWLRENPEILNFNDRFYFLRGEDVIDYYIRYENMFEDLKGLVEKRPALAGLPDLMKGIRSKDGIRPKERDFSSYIGDDEELVSCIKFFNRYHISKFGYFDLL